MAVVDVNALKKNADVCQSVVKYANEIKRLHESDGDMYNPYTGAGERRYSREMMMAMFKLFKDLPIDPLIDVTRKDTVHHGVLECVTGDRNAYFTQRAMGGRVSE